MAWPIGGFGTIRSSQALIEQTRESELNHITAPGRSSATWTCGCSPTCRCPISRWNWSACTTCLRRAGRGIDPYRWPEVVATAQARMDAAGMVTTADLVDAKLCAASRAEISGSPWPRRMAGKVTARPVGEANHRWHVKNKQASNK